MAAEVESALAAAVRADFDDWDAWRVFADWLTDRGDARGELIAIEHRLGVEALAADEQLSLQQRVHALTEAHQVEWLAGWVPPEGAELEWRCGFIVGVELNGHTLGAL